MTTSEIAIFVSGISVVIAFFSLLWNVYRDVLLKPKLKVTFGIYHIFEPDILQDEMPQEMIIEGTNHGPGAMIVTIIHGKRFSFWNYMWNQEKNYFIHQDHCNPNSDILPKKLEVGDRVRLHLPYNKECFLGGDITHIGLTNTLGKTYWAKKWML
ncbi:MAG: hypothetical protein G8D89_02085 [gamma proteobacterium symbiont of Clathrolucina costata]